MAGRSTSTKVLSKCLNPLTIFRDGESLVVPCGKCAACRLQKANAWSVRLANEIVDSKYTLFFTLTYNNKYLPVLCKYPCKVRHGADFASDHALNIRFDGVKDVPRRDGIFIESGDEVPSITNYPYKDLFPYLSKRDFVLYFKFLRKVLYDKFGKYNLFRYYLVSEFGETYYRPHAHGLIFTEFYEVALYLKQYALFACWQMQDKSLFDEYCVFADSGVSGYLTNYVTNPVGLPSFYSLHPEIGTFRLASKSPAIGYRRFDFPSIQKKVFRGVIEYTFDRKNVDGVCFLRYPSQVICRFFPKAYRFSKRGFTRLLGVYGSLFHAVVERRCSYEVISTGLSKILRPSDYVAAYTCYKLCLQFGLHPTLYVWLVDRVHYLYAMSQLKYFYEWQETVSSLDRLFSYQNLVDYSRHCDCHYMQSQFPEIDFDRLGHDKSYIYNLRKSVFAQFDVYRREVEDVLENSRKLPKVKATIGSSPSY